MSAHLLAGKPVADSLLASLKPDIAALKPTLVIVQVGSDPASTSYIRQKMTSCAAVGLQSEHRPLPASASLQELSHVIADLNRDPDVTGFILQLPLPLPLQQSVLKLLRAIDPKKDVDGLGAYNLGSMFLSTEHTHLPPATPSGIMELLDYYQIAIAGTYAVVVGRSNIVGKPLALMLLHRDATVTIAHSKTQNLPDLTRTADILIAAVGKPKLVTADMVKPGAVVIDVGVNRVGDTLVGDVDFPAVKEVASAISPVPGGVGPLTVASLIRNCVTAKKWQLADTTNNE